MGFLRKVASVGTFGLVGAAASKKKKAPPKEVSPFPDGVNPLTGLPLGQPVSDPSLPIQGLGQMRAYLPSPVSMAQRVPQGLGSDVFRSTLAPLQQQGYGLGQVDPRFLTGIQQLPGGNTAGVGFTPAGQQRIPLDDELFL